MHHCSVCCKTNIHHCSAFCINRQKIGIHGFRPPPWSPPGGPRHISNFTIGRPPSDPPTTRPRTHPEPPRTTSLSPTPDPPPPPPPTPTSDRPPDPLPTRPPPPPPPPPTSGPGQTNRQTLIQDKIKIRRKLPSPPGHEFRSRRKINCPPPRGRDSSDGKHLKFLKVVNVCCANLFGKFETRW